MPCASTFSRTLRAADNVIIMTHLADFFYQVIEDIARAGEKLGLDYEKSLLLATQTALGSAKMVENRGELTVQNLIDNVATKGGCTFVGIQTMKSENSAAMFEKVIADTTKKASELG